MAWTLLAHIPLLLLAALLAGALMERLRQNAIIGYMLAGVLLAPALRGRPETREGILALAELGVALLLFTIGIEFSWRRLRGFGAVAAGGGALQILLTAAAGILAGLAAGLDPGAALVIGAVLAMSSTAFVLRVLFDRAELDSGHGRNAVGILLVQDIAVVPVLVVLSALAGGAGTGALAARLGASAVKGALLVLVMVVASRFVLPKLLLAASSFRNRDLPILLAVTVFLAGVWASHALGLSPILGAFLAGMLLAESPFAEQVRADVIPLRAAFVTLFFASVGMLFAFPEPGGALAILFLAPAVIAGKTLLAALSVLLFRIPRGQALATGLVLAQIGEFSFVAADLGRRGGLIDEATFQTLLGTSLLTLLATPYALAGAGRLATRLAGRHGPPTFPAAHKEARVIIVGLGPAGQAVADALLEASIPCLVLELNPRTVIAHRDRFPIYVGDATQESILEYAGLASALALVVTIPDSLQARLVVRQAASRSTGVPIIARARYHREAEAIRAAGAVGIADEEKLVGRELGAKVVALLAAGSKAIRRE